MLLLYEKKTDISIALLCMCGAARSCITEIFSDMILYEKTLMYTTTNRLINCMYFLISINLSSAIGQRNCEDVNITVINIICTIVYFVNIIYKSLLHIYSHINRCIPHTLNNLLYNISKLYFFHLIYSVVENEQLHPSFMPFSPSIILHHIIHSS